jgi:hypothetical protein
MVAVVLACHKIQRDFVSFTLYEKNKVLEGVKKGTSRRLGTIARRVGKGVQVITM